MTTNDLPILSTISSDDQFLEFFRRDGTSAGKLLFGASGITFTGSSDDSALILFNVLNDLLKERIQSHPEDYLKKCIEHPSPSGSIIEQNQSAQSLEHPDDVAIDKFCNAMKQKMKQQRAKGYSGWDNPEECSVTQLQTLMRDHIEKGDPVDVGNFAMMLYRRGASTST